MEGPGLWDAVGVSQLDDFAVKGAVACHRRFRDGKRVFGVGKLHAVVLGQPEAQPSRAVRAVGSFSVQDRSNRPAACSTK